MTSRRPYWCPKTVKQRPCWCPKLILNWELNSYLMQTLSFALINLHRCWPREWKRSIGLDWQNNNFARTSLFFAHFIAVAARLQRKMLNFTFSRGREHKTRQTTTFFFFSWTLIQYFKIQLQKKLPTFDELNESESVSAIKFEIAGIHLLGDVFVAVAVVVT